VEAARRQADEGLPIRRLATRRRNLLLLLGFAVLLVVGVFVLVGKVAGYTETLDELESANPIWLAVCFGSQVVSYAAYVVLVRALAAYGGGPTIGRWLATRVVFASLGATRVLAAAGAGGLAVLFWAFRQVGFRTGEALRRVLALNTVFYACFGAAAFIAALTIVADFGGDAPRAMTLPWIAGVGLCFLLALYTTAPARADRLIATEGHGRVRRALGPAVAGAVLVRRLAEDRRANRATLVAAPLYWVGDMACLWAGLRAFGVGVTVAELVLVYATGFLANMIPLPTGGIGGVDAATTFALTAIGVPLESALLGVFAYRFFSFLLPTLPAVAALPGLQRAGRELRALAPQATAS
jgi:uncharacterized membrane protein YbhN (UPF0104 family)